MKRWAVLTVCALLFGAPAGATLVAESLWDSDSAGYYTGKVLLKEGDVLRVSLDGEASLSFLSTKVSDKSVSIDFGGTDPFSTLPQGKTSDSLKLQGKSELKTKNTVLVVRVVSVEPSGVARVEGKRSIEIGGGVDTIEVQGLVDPRDLRGREVDWRRVAELKLRFVSSSESTRNLLSETDFSGEKNTLSPEKQKELMLKVFNRFLDALFPQGGRP